MKHTLLFLAAVLFTLTGVAQSAFSFQNDVKEVTGNQPTDGAGGAAGNADLYVLNESGGDLILGWDVLESSLPASWTVQFCYWQNCVGYVPVNGVTNTMTSTTVNNFKLTVWSGTDYPVGTNDTYTLKLLVYDNANPSDADTAIMNIQVSGLDGLNEANVVVQPELYPNPVTNGEFTMENPSNQVLEVRLFDMTGKAMKQFKLAPNARLSVDVADLSSGVYLVRSSNGTKNSTTKLVVR